MKNQFRERTFYQIICPGCGLGFTGDAGSWWKYTAQAEVAALDAGWIERDDVLYCPACMKTCEACKDAEVPPGGTCPNCGEKMGNL